MINSRTITPAKIQIWLLARVYKIPKGIHLFLASNLDSRGLMSKIIGPRGSLYTPETASQGYMNFPLIGAGGSKYLNILAFLGPSIRPPREQNCQNDKSWEPGNDDVICQMLNADPWDMLNNFCFHV